MSYHFARWNHRASNWIRGVTPADGVLQVLWSLFAAVLIVSATREAWGATLEWKGPADCTSEAFALKFEQITEHQLHVAPAQTVRISVRKQASNDWIVELAISEPASEQASIRTLKGVTCADVSHAAAVSVAMALFNESSSGELDANPLPTEEPQEEASAYEQKSPLSKEPTGPTRKRSEVPPPWQFPVMAIAELDSGLLGVVALGWRVGFAVGQPSWELGFTYSALPTVTKAVEADLSVEMAAHVGVVTGCYLFGAGNPVRPALCVDYEAGGIIAKGSGSRLAVERREVTFWHAVRPEVRLYVALVEDLDVRFAVGPTVGLGRSIFEFDQGRVAHEVPLFSVRGGAGLGWIF